MGAPVKARLKDVAALAGVSVKTVSNVVNGYPHVSPEMRRRVQAALDQLGYRPNLSARSLRRGRSGIIALALPHLQEPYFAELAGAVISSAEARGCTVLVDQTDGVRSREQLALSGIRPHLIDGLLLSPLAVSTADLLERRDSTPLVLLGERISDSPFDHVTMDNVAAARAATEHLLGLGRRRVAAVGAQDEDAGHTARLRLRGYTDALTAAGTPVRPELVASVVSFHRSDGAAAMEHLLGLPEPPDAVFAFNDLLALGAMRTLHRLGVRIPEDVAVVGVDDVEESRFSTPGLSTVSPDKQHIAELALEALLRRVEGDVSEPAELRARWSLQVRGSTGGRDS
jgi:DNA-binding LacI/PurR family transcriptional regulator